jgi:GT2 family glycosyltransferase
LDTLRDLLQQEYRPLEILVVDQSAEATAELDRLVAGHRETISYHRVKFRGLPQARNYGWQHAKYEAIVYVDDDIRCGRTLVGEHLRTLSQPGVGMVAGGIDEAAGPRQRGAKPGGFNFWTATPTRGFEAVGESEAIHVPGGNFSAWREVLRLAGGVDEALSSGAALYEEAELSLRAIACGFAIRFNGQARLLHLAAGNGGCRVADIVAYIDSLAHNRTVLIGRYLKWFQAPTAYLRLLLLCLSYARCYREPRVLPAGIRGILRGRLTARQARMCTNYRENPGNRAIW